MPTTGRVTARTRPRTAGSACRTGSGGTAWRNRLFSRDPEGSAGAPLALPSGSRLNEKQRRQESAMPSPTYWDYLRLVPLLDLQGGLGDDDAGLSEDELHFIVV